MDFDDVGGAIFVLGRCGSQLDPDAAFIARVSLPAAVVSSVLIGDGPVGFLGIAYRGIAVDGGVGLMWWTSEDLGGASEVRRSSLSGSSPVVIATAGGAAETFNGIAVTRCLAPCLPGCVVDRSRGDRRRLAGTIGMSGMIDRERNAAQRDRRTGCSRRRVGVARRSTAQAAACRVPPARR